MKPQNEPDKLKYPELYRIELAAQAIQDATEGKPLYPNVTYSRDDWMWYNLASALDDIAKGLRRINEKLEDTCNHK